MTGWMGPLRDIVERLDGANRLSCGHVVQTTRSTKHFRERGRGRRQCCPVCQRKESSRLRSGLVADAR